MAPDGTDVTETDTQLIAPIIPLRREAPGPVLTVLADEPARPHSDAEPGTEPSDRSIWGDITDVLPRRPPAPTVSTTVREARGRSRTPRWLSLTAGVLTAAAVTTLVLLGGAIPGVTSHTPHAARTSALHAGSAPAPAGRLGRSTESSQPRSTSTGPRRAQRPSITRAIKGAAHSATAPDSTTRARATAPAERTSTPSTVSATRPPAGVSATREFGFEQQ